VTIESFVNVIETPKHTLLEARDIGDVEDFTADARDVLTNGGNFRSSVRLGARSGGCQSRLPSLGEAK